MVRVIVGSILAFATAVLVATMFVARTSTPVERVGDTVTADTITADSATAGTAPADTAEIIEARRVLMRQVQRLMQPIDAFAFDGNGDAVTVRSAAESIEAMMLAFPHLFPASTNLYDASLREPPTIATPAVWKKFADFRTLAEKSERSAAAAVASTDVTTLRTAAVALRDTCETCHAQFTKPYTPPQVTQEDLDFDFDAVLPGR